MPLWYTKYSKDTAMADWMGLGLWGGQIPSYLPSPQKGRHSALPSKIEGGLEGCHPFWRGYPSPLLPTSCFCWCSSRVIVGLGDSRMYAHIQTVVWPELSCLEAWHRPGYWVPHPQTGKFLSQHCMYMRHTFYYLARCIVTLVAVKLSYSYFNTFNCFKSHSMSQTFFFQGLSQKIDHQN